MSNAYTTVGLRLSRRDLNTVQELAREYGVTVPEYLDALVKRACEVERKRLKAAA